MIEGHEVSHEDFLRILDSWCGREVSVLRESTLSNRYSESMPLGTLAKDADQEGRYLVGLGGVFEVPDHEDPKLLLGLDRQSLTIAEPIGDGQFRITVIKLVNVDPAGGEAPVAD